MAQKAASGALSVEDLGAAYFSQYARPNDLGGVTFGELYCVFSLGRSSFTAQSIYYSLIGLELGGPSEGIFLGVEVVAWMAPLG